MKALLVVIMSLVLGLAGYSVYISTLHKVQSDVQLPRIFEFEKADFLELSHEQAADIAVGINETHSENIRTTNRQFSRAHQINKLLFLTILILCALFAYFAFRKNMQEPIEQPGILRSAWHGGESLWLVFWVYHFLGTLLLTGAFMWLIDKIPVLVVVLLLALMLSYFVWSTVAIWRCAVNSSSLWYFLARAYVVITILYVIRDTFYFFVLE
ncbi:hypothetical protein CWE08_11390 [Aliidiomarina iranensis]|uniref:Uncharacterized protein n=1 Tax=Aliidiomarina iranensis TaxID=1434071 RepID=A0A432VQP8_9GAMM|nr:hypothetical protein [Aliidiomarina iranensis]RUO18513.1 hypothetical protein CWE08_11390 [Aliidiomarina iranensis]